MLISLAVITKQQRGNLIDVETLFVESHDTYGGDCGLRGEKNCDCSVLVQSAYASVGISMPRTAGAQIAVAGKTIVSSQYGQNIDTSKLKKGDLVYYSWKEGT